MNLKLLAVLCYTISGSGISYSFPQYKNDVLIEISNKTSSTGTLSTTTPLTSVNTKTSSATSPQTSKNTKNSDATTPLTSDNTKTSSPTTPLTSKNTKNSSATTPLTSENTKTSSATTPLTSENTKTSSATTPLFSTSSIFTTTVGSTAQTMINERQFDGLSFIGGMFLMVGLIAIGFVAFKFYKHEKHCDNYRTL